MPTQLALQLREGTRQAHTLAESADFIKCFLKGVVEKNSYRKLLANFYFVYSALEESLERHSQHPVLAPLHQPVLFRKQSLAQDLQYYYGPAWVREVSPSLACQAYVSRIRQLSDTDPVLLIAHCYTRYMGDLSGGQILKGIAERGMNLSDGVGTAFYRFEGIPDEKQFKANYRQMLDDLPLTEAQVAAIVIEANGSFQNNMKLFQELEGSLVKAIGQMLFNTLTRRNTRSAPMAQSS
ncbi:heme oxygenase (biliverdin-producing) [Candidatus Cyanaurora vandensis]|uniref:biliverdin-producing heme oxygenase n=1 Tax=Candidatus Cyanaurora vandensis TaxID=2714958 RepID=UPI00257B183E|nr:heme oxygenase (biliverdin-producing) [Candidatus Cyanaurora vandensis]